MAYRERPFNDSSGNNIFARDSAIKKRSQKSHDVQDLELKPIPVPRDSGCYTGNSSVMSTSPQVQFTFDAADEDSSDSCGTPPTVTGESHFAHSTPLADLEALSMDMESDDEDVFQESIDSFIDSGLQSMSLNTEDGSHYARTNYHSYGHYKQTARNYYTHSDEESSTTSGEFSTAEFAGFDMDGHASRPIDIPARSSSPSSVRDSTDEDAGDDDVFSQEEPAAAAVPVLEEMPRPLMRRATVGQIHGMELRRARELVNENRPLSMEGGPHPLPDVVPNIMRRDRAMSESAITSNYHLNRVGSNLQRISDEFSNTTLQKNLNLIQMKQRNPELATGQGNSYPKAGKKRNSLLSRLFSSSHD